MDNQPELFKSKPAPTAEPTEDQPPAWMVEILLPAARKIVNNAQGTMDFHPDDRKRWAKMIAEKLADVTLNEIVEIAMINEQEDDDGVH